MSQNNASSNSLSRGDLTAKAIRQAIVRIENGRPKIIGRDRKLNIAAVAEEAGVSRATIHNNHPALADRIREAGNKVTRAQRDKKNTALKELRAKYQALREEHLRIRKLNQDMASEMATLLTENLRLRIIANNKKVVAFPSKNP